MPPTPGPAGSEPFPAIDEAIRTAREARVQLQISHIIPRSTDGGEIEGALDRVEQARRDDLAVNFDMHTRAFGTTMLNTLLPTWVSAATADERRRLLGDPSVRERMRANPSIISSFGDWTRVILLDMEPWPEYGRRSLAEVAEMRGQDAFDAAFDLLAREPEKGPYFMVLLLCYSEDQQAAFFSHPDCIPASDATTLAPDGPLSGSQLPRRLFLGCLVLRVHGQAAPLAYPRRGGSPHDRQARRCPRP